MLDHIITFHDRTYLFVSKKIANDIFSRKAEDPTQMFKVDSKGFSGTSIHKISDVDSWLKSENSRLREKKQIRCGKCFEVNDVSAQCPCRGKEKLYEYEPSLGGTPVNIMQNIAKKMKNQQNPPEELWRKICEGVMKKHIWAQQWKEQGGNKERYAHECRVVEAKARGEEEPKYNPKWIQSIKSYAAVCFRANCYQRYLNS